jgi:uncharacterized protein (DUF2147 family)|tara:strand:- start:101 stop:565 length:465 start_codon:yes stop_codon:yes gene_type:complete
MISSKIISRLIVGSFFILTSGFSFAQTSIVGQWQTKDDETGRIKSIVEITEVGGEYYGKIIELFRLPDEDADPYCDECEDDRKDQRILGMQIVRNMTVAAGKTNEWAEGTICDPKKGSIYDCEMWFEDGNTDVLKVRGYIWFVFRTQEWYRVTD